MANEFLPFANVTGANVITQAQWEALLDRSRGFQPGQAKAEEANKAWRQTALMCAALGAFIDARVAGDVRDDGNVVTLAAQLAQAIGTLAGGGGGISDAPSDNRWFLRRNAGWIDSTSLNLDGGTW